MSCSLNRSLALTLVDAARLDERTATISLEEHVAYLFRQMRSPLLRYLFSLGLPEQEAEEVAQEVFLALFRHLRQGKPRTNLRAWVFRVAHLQGLKARTRLQRNITLDREDEARSDPAPNPEEQAANGQQRKRVLAVVNALPAQDRACIHLRAEGLRYREIAGILGISLGAVAKSMERALSRLQLIEER